MRHILKRPARASRKGIGAARSVASRNTRGRPKGFDTETSEQTGVNRSTVHRSVACAENIPEDIRDEIRGTDLDKGVVLDELARTPPEQHERPEAFKSGRAVKDSESEAS